MFWHLAAGTKTCNLQTNLLEFLVFFCVPLRAGVTAHVGRKVDLRRCMLTPFVCHPAEDWEGPVLATGPGGRVSMRISRLLEIEDITCCWNFVLANGFTFPFCAPWSTTKKNNNFFSLLQIEAALSSAVPWVLKDVPQIATNIIAVFQKISLPFLKPVFWENFEAEEIGQWRKTPRLKSTVVSLKRLSS